MAHVPLYYSKHVIPIHGLPDPLFLAGFLPGPDPYLVLYSPCKVSTWSFWSLYDPNVVLCGSYTVKK